MSPCDLLDWPEVKAARERLAAAEAGRQVAARQVRRAPHGRVQESVRALQAATHQALKAALDLRSIDPESVR